MGKYRKKPVEIEAWQWNGKTLGDARAFCKAYNLPAFSVGQRGKKTGLTIETLEGDHVATPGDYIIKGIAGEYYPCKPDIFLDSYDAVKE